MSNELRIKKNVAYRKDVRLCGWCEEVGADGVMSRMNEDISLESHSVE